MSIGSAIEQSHLSAFYATFHRTIIVSFCHSIKCAFFATTVMSVFHSIIAPYNAAECSSYRTAYIVTFNSTYFSSNLATIQSANKSTELGTV